MKERPILFSAPMVRAILAGKKTQTRRIIKPQPKAVGDVFIGPKNAETLFEFYQNARCKCPYGQPGDQLWVREAFWLCDSPLSTQWPVVIYEDEIDIYGSQDNDWYELKTDEFWLGRWYEGNSPSFGHKPSIHMPRWASRIDLKIISVRAERLQDISKEDCIAEGITRHGLRGSETYGLASCLLRSETAQSAYRLLWNSINGKGSWDANPWVWRIEFEKKD